jgi:hypothetical protein
MANPNFNTAKEKDNWMTLIHGLRKNVPQYKDVSPDKFKTGHGFAVAVGGLVSDTGQTGMAA